MDEGAEETELRSGTEGGVKEGVAEPGVARDWRGSPKLGSLWMVESGGERRVWGGCGLEEEDDKWKEELGWAGMGVIVYETKR
ncbi:unnamed protein product [Linum trigynum]|uniref:Uncharacterized protein n=1 Tax=Linum trigynum TaxID=586398 RepID=A0AAV2DGD9_9ROSI